MKAPSPLVASIAIFVFFACSKGSTLRDPAPTSRPTIIGLWIGTSQLDTQASLKSTYYSLTIKKDSSLYVEGRIAADGSQYYGNGNWHLSSGGAFRAKVTILNSSLTGVNQVIIATYDRTSGLLSDGTWQNSSGGDSGTFSLLRIN